jgi:hypothetical protein
MSQLVIKSSFSGFEQLNNNLLTIDDRLICGPIEVKDRDHYANLRNAFENYQKKYIRTLLNSWLKKVKKMRQATVHDSFKH